MRRLVINADDFGLTNGVNLAIVRGNREGVVTSTTLMANASAFDHAATFAAAEQPPAKQLSVGCHVVLVDGTSVLPASECKSLLAQRSGKGLANFRDGFKSFAVASLLGQINPAEVAAEAVAQMKKIQRSGLTLSHFDTHKHLHILPHVLRPLLDAARECGVPAVRNPFTTFPPFSIAHLLRRPRLWTRASEVLLLGSLFHQFRRAVADAGMRTTDGIFGVIVTGALTIELFEATIDHLPQGTWEFVCHPGYVDDDLRNVKTRLRESRAKELEVLVSERAKKAIQARGIELISFQDL